MSKKQKQYLRPSANRLMVKKAEVATVSDGGILLPGNEGKRNEDTYGVVAKLGPDCDMSGVEVGDTVIFVTFSGTTISHEGEDYTILSPDDIVAVLSGRKS
jgi:chaperonin GroES